MGMPGHGITWSAGMAGAGMAGAGRQTFRVVPDLPG